MQLKKNDPVKLNESGTNGLSVNSREAIIRYGKDSVWIVSSVDNTDNSCFVKCVHSDGYPIPDQGYGTWVNKFNATRLIEYGNVPVFTETVTIGNGVSKIRVTNYEFENQIYNDKNQVLQILTDRVPDINPDNFKEVMSQLKKIEETWNKM